MLSKKTAETVVPMLQGLARANVLPQSDVKAVERILQNATVAQTKKKEKKKLLTAKSVAERLGVCTKSILRLRQAGRLKGILVCGSAKSLRFTEEEIENFILNGGANVE